MEERFENFLKERNWLIHRSQQECGDHLFDSELRIAMFNRITEIQEEAQSMQKIIGDEFFKFVCDHGCDAREIEQVTNDILGAKMGL